MQKRKVTVFVVPSQDGGYFAFFPHFGCATQGETLEETLHNAKDVLELTLEDPTEDDLDALEISHYPLATVREIEIEVPELAKAKG